MTGSPRCVLVVDNDPHVLDGVTYNLALAGYKVLTADSAEQAYELLAKEIIHLAVIDVRLEYNDRPDDLSGFELAKALPPYIPCVIFTAYEDKDSIKIALGEVKAKAILDKTQLDAALKLAETVNQMFVSDVKVNFDLQIHDSIHFNILARQIQTPAVDTEFLPTQDDVRQILQTLFYEANDVKVTFLLPWEPAPTRTQSGSVLVKVEPKIRHTWARPVVLKFSARDEITREAHNYTIIEPFLGGNRRADFRGAAYSRQIGGLVYSLIDAENLEVIHVFDDIFLHNDTERVIELVKRFFNQTFRIIFKDAHRESIDLTTTYTEVLHLTPGKLRMAVEEFHSGGVDELEVRFRSLEDAFLNPIKWSLLDGAFRHFDPVISPVCLCHGDLHGRNILVDEDDRFWLIDFARVAEGHALRDFAELETDIKFNLLPVVDLEVLLPFEQALLVPANFQDVLPNVSFGNDRLDHTYQVVLALRQIASELLDLQGDMREYYQALFFHTLKIMRLRSISTDKKEHALLSAALICRRLVDWPKWKYSFPSISPPALMEKPEEPQTEPSDPNDIVKGQHATLNRLLGVSIFVLLGAAVVAFLWWAMRFFNPSWQQQVAALVILSMLIIAAFGIVGLVKGETVVKVLQEITTSLLGKSSQP